MAYRSFQQVLAEKQILVCVGSGGVGKTTTAAAAGLAAAVHVGGRVLVLTIDPAKRLADALGLEGIGNVERRVPDEVLRDCGLHPRGELWAAMLDTKASWDDLVLRHAPADVDRRREGRRGRRRGLAHAARTAEHEHLARGEHRLQARGPLRPDSRPRGGHSPSSAPSASATMRVTRRP